MTIGCGAISHSVFVKYAITIIISKFNSIILFPYISIYIIRIGEKTYIYRVCLIAIVGFLYLNVATYG